MSKLPKNHDFFGTTSIGQKGQIVVPKKVREKLNIKDGDTFLVMEKDQAIVLIPTERVKRMMAQINLQLKKISGK